MGLGASPGAATGEVAFTAEEAEKLAADNRSVILVRTETSPEDIHGMHAARGIYRPRRYTSHAAVVARGMGRPCVSGAGMLKIDAARGEMVSGMSPSGAAISSLSMARPARCSRARWGCASPN